MSLARQALSKIASDANGGDERYSPVLQRPQRARLDHLPLHHGRRAIASGLSLCHWPISDGRCLWAPIYDDTWGRGRGRRRRRCWCWCIWLSVLLTASSSFKTAVLCSGFSASGIIVITLLLLALPNWNLWIIITLVVVAVSSLLLLVRIIITFFFSFLFPRQDFFITGIQRELRKTFIKSRKDCWTLEAVNQTFLRRSVAYSTFENLINPLNNKQMLRLWSFLILDYITDVVGLMLEYVRIITAKTS